jgi:hypothetical protein
MATFFAGAHAQLKDHFGGSTHWVIPEYQREFSWGPENIVRLIGDLWDGIRRLSRNDGPTVRAERGAKFLGCIIQWAREPVSGDDFVIVPGLTYLGQVHELIDGQQRTSAITLLMCELYREIGLLAKALDRTIDEEDELCKFLDVTVQREWLLQRFSRSGMTGAAPRRHPTLIRQGTDKWIHAGSPEYQSPISSYMHLTIDAILSKAPLPVQNKDEGIQKILESIRAHFQSIKTEPPSIFKDHYSQSELFEELYSGGPSVDLEAYLGTNPGNLNLIQQITAFVALAHYLLNYSAFTVITSPNQNIALDMFQSLNSTGVPLTAVQMLKPRISQSFRVNGQSFSSDPSFAKFDAVNLWLHTGTGRIRENKTLQFFLKFGLSILGSVPDNNSLSGQRVWLLKEFNEYTGDGADLQKTRDFVELMNHSVEYLGLFYFEPRDSLFRPKPPAVAGGRSSYDNFKLVHKATTTSFQLSDGAIVAYMFLIDAKHDIAHSILLSFYVKFQQTIPANLHTAVQEFEKALLMLASFFLLWRGLLGTGYPDDAYRRVLAKLHYTASKTTGNAEQIGRALRTELLNELVKGTKPTKLYKKDVAVRLAKRLRYAAGTQTLLRLFFLLACHKKSTVSPGSPQFVAHGLMIADSSGPDYLFPDIWLGAHYKSIEHIAPQTLLDGVAGDWDPSLCAASDRIQSIGNLTLLSIPLNASVNEDPSSKKRYYEGLINPGAPAGVTPLAAALIAKSPHLAHLAPVFIRLAHWDVQRAAGGVCVDEWNGTFIDQRAVNLASVVLKDLLQWLRAK